MYVRQVSDPSYTGHEQCRRFRQRISATFSRNTAKVHAATNWLATGPLLDFLLILFLQPELLGLFVILEQFRITAPGDHGAQRLLGIFRGHMVLQLVPEAHGRGPV